MASIINYYRENKHTFVWKNIALLIGFHPIALFALFRVISGSVRVNTVLFSKLHLFGSLTINDEQQIYMFKLIFCDVILQILH